MSTASTIVVIVVAVIFLGFFIKLLKTPIKLAFKLLLHAVGGFVMLFLVNFFGSYLGISLEQAKTADAFEHPQFLIFILRRSRGRPRPCR